MIQKSHKRDILISIIIFVIVIGVLVFLTLDRKNNKTIDEQYLGRSWQVGQDGVKVSVLREGKGEISKVGDTILVNYVGSFSDGEIFESNTGEEPFSLTLGTTPVIEGWGMGVEGMRVGEKRNIEINPEYAYGEKGVPGIVPPYAKLVYDVELVAIKK